MNTEGPVAVIDVGSNTIKLSVISGTVSLNLLHRDVRYDRIGRNLGDDGKLSDEAIHLAAESVKALKLEAEKHKPSKILVVATSAIRSAVNRDTCIKTIEELSGLPVRVLSGMEEAELIGQGVGTDPVLSDMDGNYCFVDIGGGSIECARFRDNELQQAVSLPLGAVRLTERFIQNPEEIISLDDSEAIFEFVSEELKHSSFDFF